MSSSDALCVLIQVIELRNARLSPNETAVVRVRFKNDSQETGASRGRFDHDIVWEMTTDNYKTFKATRQVFKLEVFSGSNKLGYLVIPLQEIRVNDTQSSWVALLQPPKLSRPELLLRTRVVRADDYYREVAEMQAKMEAALLAPKSNPTAAAPVSSSSSIRSSEGPDNSVIEIGTDGGFIINLSIRIDGVSGLDASGSLYFFYQIFDSEVRSPQFSSPSDFRAQKREFTLSTSKQDLLAYFGQPVELYICSASTAIAAVSVSSLSTLARRWFKSHANESMCESLELRPLIPSVRLGRAASVSITITMSGRQGGGAQTETSVILEPVAASVSQPSSVDPPKNAPSSLGPEFAKLYRMQLRIASIKSLQPQRALGSLMKGFSSLEEYLSKTTEETWLYTRFAYPLLFGEAHVFSNPTCLVQRTEEKSVMLPHLQIGGSLFSFEFAMSERNMRVALQEASIGVEIWRMASPPQGQAASRPASMSEGQDEFVGIAVASLSVIDSSQGTRASLGDGEVCFSADQYFPVLPELPENGVQRPCIGHVQLLDLGPFEVARTRDQQLREQLETTRAKLEELWEEVQKERKRADKFETRLLVAAFEEQMAQPDSEEMERVHAKQILKLQEQLKEQRELNKECIEALEELGRENEVLKASSKRRASVASPLIRRVHCNNLQSPGSNRSVNRSLNISTCENEAPNENVTDLSNMSSAPEVEML